MRHKEQTISLEQACLPSRCVLQGEAVPLRDGETVLPWTQEPWIQASALPVRRFGSLIGVLLVDSEIAPEQSQTMEELAEVFSLSLDRVSEIYRTRQALAKFEELAIKAIEKLSGQRRGHTSAVCQLAADLAEFLDLSAQARKRLWSAALYHDVGQVLLEDQGRLAQELEHAEAGGQFLQQTELYSELAPLVSYHHRDFQEHPSLTLEQGILGLAEGFEEFLDSQTHLAFQAKLAIFFQEKSKSYHPEVVDALAGLIDSGRLDRLKN